MGSSCVLCGKHFGMTEEDFELVTFTGTRASNESVCTAVFQVCMRCLNTRFELNRKRDYDRAGELGA